MSQVTWVMSHMMRVMSLTCHVYHVSYDVSHVAGHMSRVSYDVSHVSSAVSHDIRYDV